MLGLRELSAEEITLVLETADAFKQVGTREVKKVPALQGKTLINLFVEPSTRTRTSFELAAKRLSADIINISAAASSLTKGETLKDTARVLEANHADIIVLRHSSAGAPQFLASANRRQRDQRRRWRARTSHAGTARSLYDSRKEGRGGRSARRDYRRHSFQPRRALEYFCAS